MGYIAYFRQLFWVLGVTASVVFVSYIFLPEIVKYLYAAYLLELFVLGGMLLTFLRWLSRQESLPADFTESRLLKLGLIAYWFCMYPAVPYMLHKSGFGSQYHFYYYVFVAYLAAAFIFSLTLKDQEQDPLASSLTTKFAGLLIFGSGCVFVFLSYYSEHWRL